MRVILTALLLITLCSCSNTVIVWSVTEIIGFCIIGLALFLWIAATVFLKVSKYFENRRKLKEKQL